MVAPVAASGVRESREAGARSFGNSRCVGPTRGDETSCCTGSIVTRRARDVRCLYEGTRHCRDPRRFGVPAARSARPVLLQYLDKPLSCCVVICAEVPRPRREQGKPARPTDWRTHAWFGQVFFG